MIRAMPCVVIQGASAASHVSRPRVRRCLSYVQCATRLSKSCHVETLLPKLPGTLDAPPMYRLVGSACGQSRFLDHQLWEDGCIADPLGSPIACSQRSTQARKETIVLPIIHRAESRSSHSRYPTTKKNQMSQCHNVTLKHITFSHRSTSHKQHSITIVHFLTRRIGQHTRYGHLAAPSVQGTPFCVSEARGQRPNSKERQIH